MACSNLMSRLITLIRAGESVLLTGRPGCGKSDIAAQCVQEAGRSLIVSHPVISDPVDYRGLPANVGGRAEFLPFGDLRAMIDASEPTTVFFDDLGQAAHSVQAALMQIVLARRIGDHAVSRHVSFVAATNRVRDRAGVSSILAPLINRFAQIIEIDPSIDDWMSWALRNGVPTEVVGFAAWRPALLAEEPTKEIAAFCSPRSLAALGRLRKLGLTGIDTACGAIGAGAGAEFMAFMATAQKLPKIEEILKSPSKAAIPAETSAKYAAISLLLNHAAGDTADALTTYALRLGDEYAFLFLTSVITACPEFGGTDRYQKWAEKNANYLKQ